MIVFGTFLSDGQVGTPSPYTLGVWVHTDEYLIILKGVDIPSVMTHCVLNKMLLLEDSAAARLSQGVQNFLSRRIPLCITGEFGPPPGPPSVRATQASVA